MFQRDVGAGALLSRACRDPRHGEAPDAVAPGPLNISVGL